MLVKSGYVLRVQDHKDIRKNNARRRILAGGPSPPPPSAENPEHFVPIDNIIWLRQCMNNPDEHDLLLILVKYRKHPFTGRLLSLKVIFDIPEQLIK